MRGRGAAWAAGVSLLAAAVCAVSAEAASAAPSRAASAVATGTDMVTPTATDGSTPTAAVTPTATDTPTGTATATPSPTAVATSSVGPISIDTADVRPGIPVHISYTVVLKDPASTVTCRQGPQSGPLETVPCDSLASFAVPADHAGWQYASVTVTDPDGTLTNNGVSWFVDKAAPQASMWGVYPTPVWQMSADDDFRMGRIVGRLVERDYTGRWLPFVTSPAWAGTPSVTTPRSATVNLPYGTKPGLTVCPQVQSTDAAGNTQPWTNANPQLRTSVCDTTPFDDRALTRHGTWTSASWARAYKGTLTKSSTYGATLTLPASFSYEMALRFNACDYCGSFAIYNGSKLISTVNTSGYLQTRQTWVVASTPALTGAFSIKVVSRGKPVFIDSLTVRSIYHLS